jgi:hypothetical protein
MRKQTDDELSTKRETAAELKVSRRPIDYWTAGPTPRLPYVKFGNEKRFVRGDLRRFIEKHKVHARQEAA